MTLTLSLALLSSPLAVQQNPPPVFEERMVEVAKGRSIFLRCTGSGPVTVLFDAGGSDWSVVWSSVQQAIAGKAQACAYDRAGLGKSDSARGPRTPVAIAYDIHALIAAAGFQRPVVLVGHSLGGFNAKLVAALFPDDIAGLVLIDPAEDRTWERTRDQLGKKYGVRFAAQAELLDHTFFPGLVARYRNCVRVAAGTGLKVGTPEYRGCADPDRPALGPDVNAERQKVHVTLAYQEAQASEIEWCVYADASNDSVYARLFRPGVLGTKPVAVLTHQEEPSTDPVDLLNTEQGLLLHRETAALSSRGTHEVVSDSGHYVQLDQPDAVVAAIVRVVSQVSK